MKRAKNGADAGGAGAGERADQPRAAGGGALAGLTVVLGVTGGIAAYKAAELCRLLGKAGALVRVIMTEAAGQFITPLTLQTLSGHRVARDLFDLSEESEIGHIRLADQADLLVVAPATADAIARMAGGRADDLLAAVVLASRAPVLLAPAMNVNMWSNPLTQANLARLLGPAGGGRFSTVGPDRGELACGWIGAGRLIEPAEIVAEAERIAGAIDRPPAGAVAAGAAPGGLAGCKVVVTAGPTIEALDDVRFLGNRSSGKMGFAMAQAAAARGAEVLLIAGPVALPTPPGVRGRIDVESAEEMRRAVVAAAAVANVVVMTAAVADFRPAVRSPGKLSRRDAVGAPFSIALEANPDILAELGRARRADGAPWLIGFAAEATGGAALQDRARAKLIEKRCDVVIANDVSAPDVGFGVDDNAVTVIFADGSAQRLPRAPKRVIAEQIWDRLAPALALARGDRDGGTRAPSTIDPLPRHGVEPPELAPGGGGQVKHG
jgi:phosphopantothenoylcysteine decarboxylase/phosphopantothenate--cysteine ligase